MKIQFFNPPVHHYAGIQYRMNPPLGLPILSAVLRRAGHVCEVADLEALGTGWAAEIIPTEAAAPVGPWTETNQTTAGGVTSALQAGSQRKVTVTSSIGAYVTLSGTITDSVLDLGGNTIDALIFSNPAVITRFRVQNGKIGAVHCPTTLSTPATDISFVGIDIGMDLSSAPNRTNVPAFLFNGFLRMTVSDLVGRGYNVGATAGGQVFQVAAGSDLLIVNTSAAAYQGATANDWGFRGGGYGADTVSRILFVDSMIQGGNAAAAVRISHADGVAMWSTPGARGTSLSSAAVNLRIPYTFQDVGVVATPAIATDHMVISHSRLVAADQNASGFTFQVGGAGTTTGSAGWRLSDLAITATSSGLVQASTITSLESGVTGQGGDADYNVGTHSFTYTSPVVQPSWPTRASYLLGTSRSGDPFAL
jgi:hypothetical protein